MIFLVNLILSLTIFSLFTYHDKAYGQALQIGKVTIQKTEDTIIFSSRTFVLRHKLSALSLNYAYVLTTPYVSYRGYDGIVNPGMSNGLIALPNRGLRSEDFPKFTFFNERKSCIGILTGSAGGSGGSSQALTIFDTLTAQHFQVGTVDMQDPEWISKDGHPVAFIEKSAIWYLGGHALSLGYEPRISQCYTIKDGKLKVSTELEKELCRKKYVEILFTPEEMNILRDDDIFNLNRDLAVKLLDKIYYGLKLGKHNELKDFMDKINPKYAEETKLMFKKVEVISKLNNWLLQLKRNLFHVVN